MHHKARSNRLPGINKALNGYTYILISAGRKPTSGYSLKIGNMEGYEKAIVLHALLYSPCDDALVARVPTYPTILIRYTADERDIIFSLEDTRNPRYG